MQNLTSASCSVTPICYKGDEISRLSRPVIEFPILGYLGRLGDFGGLKYFGCKISRQILARRPRFPIKATRPRFPIKATKYRAYLAQLSSPPLSSIIKIPIVGYFGVLGVFRYFGYLGVLGYIATSCAKSDARILLDDPDFLYRRRNIALISLSYRNPHCGLFQALGAGVT